MHSQSEASPVRGPWAVAIVALLLAACGDGGSEADQPGGEEEDQPASVEVGSEAALEEAATESFMAFVTGDDQTYFNSLSGECRETFEFAAVQSHLQGRRFTATNVGGIDLSDVGVSAVEIEGFAGDSAEVSLVVAGTGEAFKESLPSRWVFEEGAWRSAECSDFQEARGGLEGLGTDASDPIAIGGVGDVNGWLVVVYASEVLEERDLVDLGGADSAAEGNRLFTTQVGLTYIGADASVTIGDQLGFAVVRGSTVYGDETSCDTSFYGFDLSAELGPGDDAGRAIICREVAAGDAEGLLLRVAHMPTGDTYWFDLSQP